MPVEQWTEVELTGRRSKTAQRWIAGMLALAGAVGLVFSIFTDPELWVVLSTGVVCLFLVVVGISLWYNVGKSADDTVELVKTGSRTPLRVLRAEEIHDDSIIFRLFLRMPEPELVVVHHQCSQGQCVEAARAAPDAEVPAILDPATKTWGVVHGRLG